MDSITTTPYPGSSLLVTFSRDPLLLLPLPLRQPPNRPRDDRLRGKSSSGVYEPLGEPRAVGNGVRQEGQPGVEGVAGGVHDAQHDRPLLGVAPADLVGPGHGQRPVGDGGAGHDEGEPLQPRGDVPDGEEQRGQEPEERRDGHHERPVARVVGQHGEGHRDDQLDGGLGRRDDVLEGSCGISVL